MIAQGNEVGFVRDTRERVIVGVPEFRPRGRALGEGGGRAVIRLLLFIVIGQLGREPL
jgi:hypothetical protein